MSMFELSYLRSHTLCRRVLHIFWSISIWRTTLPLGSTMCDTGLIRDIHFKNVGKSRFSKMGQILITRITLWGRVLASWTLWVFCSARRDLQQSLWGPPDRMMASGQKTSTFTFGLNLAFNFWPWRGCLDQKFLRPICAPTPTGLEAILKNFAGKS